MFPETRVLRHNSSKSVQRFDLQLRWRTNKKAQTINISPLRGGDAPEPIDMPFGLLSGVPDVITDAKFYVNRLRGCSATAPISYTFSNDPYNSSALPCRLWFTRIALAIIVRCPLAS